MKPNPPAAPADPVLLLIAAGWLAAEALAALLIATLALVLTFAGWRPSPAPVRAATARGAADPDAHQPAASAPVRAAPGADPDVHPLQRLPVVELRRLARAAGLPRLARCGRRAQLLEALAAAPG